MPVFDKDRRILSALIMLSVFVLIDCSSLGVYRNSFRSVPNSQFLDDDILVQTDATFGVTIVGFTDNFEFLYEPSNPLSLKQAAQKQAYRYIINGSYFEGSRVHAGWLSIFGVQEAPIKVDRQLTHMAILDTSMGYLAFPELTLWDSSMTSPKNLEFQTGPLVIYASQIDTLSIQASINGTGAHLRTLLAMTEEDGMFYFIITRKPCGLEELGDHLLSYEIFAGKTLHVMNLDGGSSTALFSQDHPELNFNTERPLPILLGIH